MSSAITISSDTPPYYSYSDDSGASYGLSDGGGGPAAAAARRAVPRYDVIEPDGLASAQDAALDAVASLLGVSQGDARTLLIHFRWSADALSATLADKGVEAVFAAAGVPPPSHTGAPRAGPPPTPIDCTICFCPADPYEATAMACGHAFCNDCWRSHLAARLETGAGSRLPCAAPKCGAACDEGAVRALLAETPAGERHARALATSIVDDNPAAWWCPSVPHCGRALRARGDALVEMRCACGAGALCSRCGEGPHAPATCAMARVWLAKCRDDSETVAWMAANTRACPKCGKSVEKNGGCNLVMCRCGQPFCWLCGGATGVAHTWTAIAGHSCGRFRDEAAAAAGVARASIRRYMHYYTRWDAHTKSATLEAARSPTLGACEASLLAAAAAEAGVGGGATDGSPGTSSGGGGAGAAAAAAAVAGTGWLAAAAAALADARARLAASYVFAFFMFDGGDFYAAADGVPMPLADGGPCASQALFEDQQAALEGEAERLSGLLEAAPGAVPGGAAGLRLAVINSAVNVERRVRLMFDAAGELLAGLTCGGTEIAAYVGPPGATPWGGSWGDAVAGAGATTATSSLMQGAVAAAGAGPAVKRGRVR